MSENAIVSIPNVGDPAVLADILMYSARDALYVLMTNGNPEDYANHVFSVASIFMGATDSIELPKGWVSGRAGAALRQPLEAVLAEMEPEDLERFADNESLFPLAVMTCFQEAASIAEVWCDSHPTVDDTNEVLKNLLHDPIFTAHFATWADIILGDYAVKNK